MSIILSTKGDAEQLKKSSVESGRLAESPFRELPKRGKEQGVLSLCWDLGNG